MATVGRVLFESGEHDEEDEEEAEEMEEYELPMHDDDPPQQHDNRGSSANNSSERSAREQDCSGDKDVTAPTDSSAAGQRSSQIETRIGLSQGGTTTLASSSSVPRRVPSVRSVACGSDVPMATESQAKYDDLFRRTTMAAVSLFPPFSVQTVPAPSAPPHLWQQRAPSDLDRRASSSPRTPITRDQWTGRLDGYLQNSVSGRSPWKCRFAGAAVGAGAAVPVASTGASLMSASASAYVLRQEVLQVIDTLACDALAAKEALEHEHRRELAEQQSMWHRVVAALRQEVARLEHALELERSAHHVARLQASIQLQHNEDEGGKHPPMGSSRSPRRRTDESALPPLTARSPMHQRDGIRKRDTTSPDTPSESGLTAQRIAEALVHLMNKKPAKAPSMPSAPLYTHSPRARKRQ